MSISVTTDRDTVAAPVPLSPVAPHPTTESGLEVPRVLGRIEAPQPGPTLIVVGGMHGNEQAGVLALQRLMPRLAADPTGLTRGCLIGLAGNRKALRQKRRYLVHDLNRHWLPQRVARLHASAGSLSDEDEELRDLHRELETALFEARETVYLLDLHTTSGPELPFVTLDDTLRNRPFAFAFPAPVVLGLEEELAGTLSSYVDALGLITAGFESGQHDTPAAIDRAEDAIWIALESSGILQPGSRPEVAAARARLAGECGDLPHVVEIRYRHAIETEDRFKMDPGYTNFQPVTRGQRLGSDRRGPVLSPQNGLILMPLYQAQGADGFFIVRQVHRIWLRASAVVRRLRFERFLHLLPGVRRHPDHEGRFMVDRRYARWLALELFHLLGFSRQGAVTSRLIVMTRRQHDRPPTPPGLP